MRARRFTIAAAVLTAGCASLLGPDGELPDVSSRPIGIAMVERATGSDALDRITKRKPLLDGFDRHRGRGRGVVVYVFDGGIDTSNAELTGRVRIGYDGFPGGQRVCNAHGTAVAGAIAGRTLGVAPEADLVDVKIISCWNHRGTISAIVAAAKWAIDDHGSNRRPAIANWSFVVDSTRAVPEIDQAVQLLRDAGIAVVVSAGNLEMDACRLSPANAPYTLVVGASSLARPGAGQRVRDTRAPGTAWGDCVDLYAPGDSVLLPGADDGGPTAFWRGTSMAAGYVSGAAAILLEANPTMTPDSLTATIRRRATADVVDERQAMRAGQRARLLYIGF